MRVAVEKVEGVEDADVRLDDGEAVISLEGSNAVSLARLREIVRDQGFTPQDAEIRVRAVVRKASGGLVLEVPGSGEVYRAGGEADDLAALVARLEEPVVVRGRVGEKSPGRIHVTSVGAGNGAPPSE